MSMCKQSFMFVSSIKKNFKTLSTINVLKAQYKNLNTYVNYHKFHTSSILEKNVAFKLSDIGEGIREVVIKEWFVKAGDKVSQFDNICEVQSDKASVTITSRYDGVITKLHHTVDDTVLVGQALIDIDVINDEGSEDNNEIIKDVSTPTKNEAIHTNINESQKYEICIPSVRRLAKQNNINLSLVKGTGKKGRILKEDILRFLEGEIKTKETPVKGTEKTVPLSPFQKAMVKTMTEALKIPHFVYSDEISVKNLTVIRNVIKPETKKHDLKISFMPFFIKAASNALLKYPILNGSLDEKCENVIYKPHHNIGVAMDTTVGLAVPVIKNVEKLSVVEIAKELNKLMKTGKNGNFSTEDLTGGTFSISNIGIIGGTYTHPVILTPQVSIIAIGKVKVVPKFDESNNIVPDEVICVSGSADHRIIDGVTMANFICEIKKQIENPYLIFLNF